MGSEKAWCLLPEVEKLYWSSAETRRRRQLCLVGTEVPEEVLAEVAGELIEGCI